MNFEGKEKQTACDRHVSWDVLSWEGRCGVEQRGTPEFIWLGQERTKLEAAASCWQGRQFQPHTSEAHSSTLASLPSPVKHPC